MRKLAIVIFSLAILFTSNTAHAQEQTLRGSVVETTERTDDTLTGNPNITEYKVKLENQSEEIDAIGTNTADIFAKGDAVLLIKAQGPTGEEIYYITDHVRTDSMLTLFLVFAAVVLLISRRAGLSSLLGMGYSFFIIFNYLLPKLYMGGNPIIVTLMSVALIAPVSFALSHGLNQKTYTALAATLLSLTITSLLALFFINSTHLSGFGSEEAYFLHLAQESINIRGIFLAGIIIGTLGILDDATVTQASIVSQLKSSTRNLSSYDLFSRAMSVGHDHIASTVNTLILVYTGSALPLLLLFIQSNESFFTVLNNQIIAEEVVTMLVSSIGLILSIPIATALAVLFVSKGAGDDHHHHAH